MRAPRPYLTLASLCGALLPLSSPASQFLDPLDGKFDMSSYLSDNAFGFLPVPIIISEPAVDQGLGMIGMFFHEDDEKTSWNKLSSAACRCDVSGSCHDE